jgi:hypothetical protein
MSDSVRRSSSKPNALQNPAPADAEAVDAPPVAPEVAGDEPTVDEPETSARPVAPNPNPPNPSARRPEIPVAGGVGRGSLANALAGDVARRAEREQRNNALRPNPPQQGQPEGPGGVRMGRTSLQGQGLTAGVTFGGHLDGSRVEAGVSVNGGGPSVPISESEDEE